MELGQDIVEWLARVLVVLNHPVLLPKCYLGKDRILFFERESYSFMFY
jgi:hypothetical protein